MKVDQPEHERGPTLGSRWSWLAPVFLLLIFASLPFTETSVSDSERSVIRAAYPDATVAIPFQAFDGLLVALTAPTQGAMASDHGARLLIALDELSEAQADYSPQSLQRVPALLQAQTFASFPARPEHLLSSYIEYQRRRENAGAAPRQQEREALQNEIFGEAFAERLFSEERKLWQQMQQMVRPQPEGIEP